MPRSQLYAQKRTKLDQDLRSTLVGNRLSMRTSATRRIGNETNGLSNVHNPVCLSTANSGLGKKPMSPCCRPLPRYRSTCKESSLPAEGPQTRSARIKEMPGDCLGGTSPVISNHRARLQDMWILPPLQDSRVSSHPTLRIWTAKNARAFRGSCYP